MEIRLERQTNKQRATNESVDMNQRRQSKQREAGFGFGGGGGGEMRHRKYERKNVWLAALDSSTHNKWGGNSGVYNWVHLTENLQSFRD